MKARDVYATAEGFVDLTIQVGTPLFKFTFATGEPPYRQLTHSVGDGIALQSGRVAVDGSGMAYALLCDNQKTHYLVDMTGVERCQIPQGGRGSCALFVNAGVLEIHAQGDTKDYGATCPILVYGVDGVLKPERTYQAQYGSEGILQVLGPSSIQSSSSGRHPWENGIETWNTVHAGDWSAGQINRIPPGGSNNGTIGLVPPEGPIQIAALTPTWNGYTNQPAYLAVSNGVPRVALQDPSPNIQTPGPDEIVWLALDANGNLPQPDLPQTPDLPEQGKTPPTDKPVPPVSETPKPIPQPEQPKVEPKPAPVDDDDLADTLEAIAKLLRRLPPGLRKTLRDRLFGKAAL